MAAPAPTPPPNGHRLELILSRLLTTGVMTSAAVCLAGAALYLFHAGHAKARDLSTYQSQPESLTSPLAIVRGAAHLEPASLILFGLLLVFLTPVARGAFSVVLFAMERDRLYVLITLVVLAAAADRAGGRDRVAAPDMPADALRPGASPTAWDTSTGAPLASHDASASSSRANQHLRDGAHAARPSARGTPSPTHQTITPPAATPLPAPGNAPCSLQPPPWSSATSAQHCTRAPACAAAQVTRSQGSYGYPGSSQ